MLLGKDMFAVEPIFLCFLLLGNRYSGVELLGGLF